MKDAYSHAVQDVLARTQFGTRTETALEPGWVVSWSNGNRNWGRFMTRPVKRGQQVSLDANQIIVYAKAREADRIASHLPAPPIDAASFEARFERGPEQFMSNPKGPEEEWIEGEESKGPHDYHSKKHSPHEGDIPPWGQAGWSEFPMADKVAYVNAYTLIENAASFSDNLNRYGTSSHVGIFPPGLQLGSDAYYVPIAAIPVRKGDQESRDRYFAYIEWLVKSLKLTFTRIEVQDKFPEGNLSETTGLHEGEVKLANNKWFTYFTDIPFRHKRLEFMNAYTVNRYYGGPEEGGWWYNAGEPLASIPFIKGYEPTQKSLEEYLRNAIGWHSQFDLGSVLGHDRFDVSAEEAFASPYPKETPRYE